MIVVAAVDESPLAPLVVARALEQARWRDAELHVVHVVSLPTVYSEVAIDWNEVVEAQQAIVWAGVESTLADANVEVQRVDLEGYPPDVLAAYAAEKEAALLVVGSRGRGELASLVLGSTSHRAIHLADCDVLVINRPRTD
jgi:nucleotide-binding universal stress UspA family protein